MKNSILFIISILFICSYCTSEEINPPEKDCKQPSMGYISATINGKAFIRKNPCDYVVYKKVNGLENLSFVDFDLKKVKYNANNETVKIPDQISIEFISVNKLEEGCVEIVDGELIENSANFIVLCGIYKDAVIRIEEFKKGFYSIDWSKSAKICLNQFGGPHGVAKGTFSFTGKDTSSGINKFITIENGKFEFNLQ